METNPSLFKKNKRKEIIILILCFLLSFALRFYTFDKKSLWIDEVHTFADSRQSLKGQIDYFKEKPSDLLHPPLFYVLTHLFHPFPKPERDLRMIPLIFGALSIPMIYFLAKLFSPHIALPCTLSLTFMAYHISFSQDGRSYSLLIFLGIVSLYFFLKHLKTLSKRELVLSAFFYAISFYTSYVAIPFIVLSQLLWFYQTGENDKKPPFSSFVTFNALIFVLCMPWILFIALNYKGQPVRDYFQELGSFWNILTGILNDWVPHTPLTVASVALLILFPFVSKNRRNTFILLTVCFIPVVVIFLFCELLDIRHYFSSRYVINFLPLFLITLYLSLEAIETKFVKLKGMSRLRLLFVILFIATNLTILPLYYRSEKQDFRGLVTYLEGQLRDGDKIYVRSIAYIPGMLHYFGIIPKYRHHDVPTWWNESEKAVESKISLVSQEKKFTIIFSTSCCAQFVEDGSRLWMVVGKPAAKETKENYPCVLKGYFDGSFCNFRRFPSDASMYLFLWDPSSPEEKGIELSVE